MIFDANVVVKWIVDEDGSEAARTASSRVRDIAAPAHVAVEVGRALLRHVRAGSISADDASRSLRGVVSSIDLIPTELLIDEAFQLALSASVTIYDALYVVAALRRDQLLLTADARLVAGLNRTVWRGRAVLLNEFVPQVPKGA